jgi:NAD(P)-dependent dehydrogenase (short-subunit alcohol dehydrogenase family)
MHDKKIAMVTGGNRGIGLSMVEGLLKEGFTVLMGSRNVEAGNLALEYLEEHSDNLEMIQLDVSKRKSVLRAFEEVSEKYGRLDVLINNAGIIGSGKKPLKDGDLKEVKKIMKTNFYGPMNMNTVFLPLLRKSDDARIINISSGMGALEDLFGAYAGYRLSKAGLNAQTILLSNDLRGENIKVFSMCPGWVKTEMGGAEAPRTPEQGAETAIWLATSDEPETGKFYRDKQVISF